MADASPPQNIDPASRVRNLGQLGSSVDIDNNVPARRYLRSGLEMERMANVYLEEGNLEYAFVLYNKLITLFVEKLPQHKQYKQLTPANRSDSKKRATRALKRAEELKAILRKRYEKELEIWKVKEVERIKLQKEEEEREKIRQQEKEFAEQQEIERQKEIEKRRREEKERNDKLTVNSLPAVIPSAPSPSSHDALNRGVSLDLNTASDTYPELNDDISNLHSAENERRTTPTIDRSTKPSWTDFDSGIRTLNIPTELMRKFIEIASPNTRQNRETCGILAGRLSQNSFHVSHLIIPKQTSTSDSCTTLSEEDIFTYQDSHNLITLGWIHTHPSQTAFMSSIDLHTHCSYQLMLPEAVAIVCAPKHSQTGMYSLTSEYGLKFIAACKKQGFHPHPKEPPIYEESGHIKLDGTSSIHVADLR